jgi:Ca2+-binding RTX toxin-like protein
LKTKLTENNIASTNIYLNPAKPTDTDQFSVLDSLDYETGKYLVNGANDLMIGMGQRDAMYGRKGDDVLIGEGGGDVLVGGEGKDVLYGGKGNDMLIGGIGNDILMGGENDDTYVINAGDGEDRIEDKQGNNKIYLCGKEINFFYDAGSGQYKSLDGSLTGVKNAANELVVKHDASNTKVTLKNFQWGDFGTTLITLPANPETYNIINGTDQGWRGDPGDDFYDTALNDKIIAGGGDDYVLCDVGGANWISGGDGYDSIDGELSSSSIIEGATSRDSVSSEP